MAREISNEVSGKRQRQRDILPLPPARTWALDWNVPVGVTIDTALQLLNLCVAALNLLASDLRVTSGFPDVRAPTVAQQQVYKHVAHRCTRFLEQLEMFCGMNVEWQGSFQHFESKSSGKYPSMQAEAVDLPSKAGTCDPSLLLIGDLASITVDAQHIFPGQSRVADTPLGPDRTKRAEYVKLVFKQLQCGKTRLRQHCREVGDVFCVAKAHGKQREVWNGSQVSQMAARPPPPGKLANPACFVDLLFEHGQEVHMSKRDVQTCFDNLQAPEQLQEWFGRPPVTLHELNRVTGVSTKKLQKYIVKIKGQGCGIRLSVHAAFSYEHGVADGFQLELLHCSSLHCVLLL